ncbi:MAG: C4-dicarboxylate transporter DctA [Alphaproteobacteria bacterium]|nr:C4-dicarboxylate transporter DctA [Alphaproteobacteria bacterium]
MVPIHENAWGPMAAQKKSWLSHLYIQVLIAIGIGVALGYFAPDIGQKMKPLGDGFIKLIKMVIAPIIFCTVVSGIAHMGDMKSAGRLGVKSLFYFFCATTLALIIGLIVGTAGGAGNGMNIDVSSIDPSAVDSYLSAASATKSESFTEFLLNLIPKTFVGAFAEGNLLQVLVIAILFAWAMLSLGAKGKPILQGIDLVAQVFFKIIAIIMKLAPLGAFGAMAFTIGAYGVETLGNLLYFMVLFYVTCLAFVFVGLALLLKVTTGLSIWQLIKYIREEIFIVLGTCSSETVLPRILDKLEKLGVHKQVVGMVIPTGYSFNLDGSSIYFTMAVVFLAQATNTPLTWEQEVAILLTMLFTSKGAAAVVGSAFIVLTGTLSTLDIIPVVAVTIVLGIDRFMAEARAITNLIGNCVGTLVIGRWEKAIDLVHAKKVLSGAIEVHAASDPEDVILESHALDAASKKV